MTLWACAAIVLVPVRIAGTCSRFIPRSDGVAPRRAGECATCSAEPPRCELARALQPVLERANTLQGQLAFAACFQSRFEIVERQQAPAAPRRSGIKLCDQERTFEAKKEHWRQRWRRIMRSLNLSRAQQVRARLARGERGAVAARRRLPRGCRAHGLQAGMLLSACLVRAPPGCATP